MDRSERIVTLLHPGPVRHVAQGQRKDRISLLPMRTPVTLRQARHEDLYPPILIQHMGAYHAYVGFEGGLWLRIDGSRPSKGLLPLGEEGLVALLEGTTPEENFANTDAARALDGSPLLGPLRKWRRTFDVVDLASSRIVLDDAREEASLAAARFASERILLVGDRPYIRAHVPLARLGENGSSMSLQRFIVEPFPVHWRGEFKPVNCNLSSELQGYPVRVDRLGPTHAMLAALKLLPHPDLHERAAAAAQIPSHLQADDDLALMANVLPGLAVEHAERLMRSAGPAVGTDLTDAVSALKPCEVRASVGMYGPDDAEEVLHRVRDVVVAAQAILAGAHAPRLDAMRTWIDEVAVPRLRDRGLVDDADISGEDMEALGSLDVPPP